MSLNKTPSSKAQRAAERAAQLEQFKKKQAIEKRKRLIGLVLTIIGVALVIAIVTVVIVVNAQPKAPVAAPSASSTTADGVQTWSGLAQTHTTSAVTYQMTPPAGGPHNPVWLNCGVYTQAVPNVNAVHDLEHGAVWITYDPAQVSADQITALTALTPTTYAVLSPYPGMDTPMAISAWGAQLKFSDPADPRVMSFLTTYWRSATSPEPGAPCTGGLDAPGKVS